MPTLQSRLMRCEEHGKHTTSVRLIWLSCKHWTQKNGELVGKIRKFGLAFRCLCKVTSLIALSLALLADRVPSWKPSSSTTALMESNNQSEAQNNINLTS